MPRFCLELHFHHSIVKGNNREAMSPFPSGISLIGFVKKEKKKKEQSADRVLFASVDRTEICFKSANRAA